MTILVTGARGQIGGAVLTELLAAGQPVRVSSRDPRSVDVPAGAEVVRADLTDRASLPDALAGVRKVFLYAHPEAAADFAAEARKAGVEHVVLLSSSSVVWPDAAANPIAVRHAVVERALDEAGLDRTFVRPGYFATNTLRWQSIRTDRVLRTAFPDATSSPVHERDIAEVAVRALLGDTYRGAAPLVLGPGPITVREQVATIAAALGEPVRLEQVDRETYRAEQLTQLPEPLVDRLLRTGGVVPALPAELGTDATAEILGRPATPFEVWARDHAEDFR
ncbi:SDR family oxidoreductase [Nocardia aurantia]|uniref:NAD(P)H azoreductase n=1 Tax=Nocardia aurantia TaxID=2585199 RepID=A0A7K0DN60_9NOCA|nr:NAD(P)H-binding protein [Nocardia aurantia]MQY26802.1 NAD(P)H azoreductase [Nocardia aurantia]